MRIILVSLFIMPLFMSSCSKEFIDDCKDAISGSHVKIQPPKGCAENELLK